MQWVLLAAGITAVLGLTAMNVYSLYTLRNSSIESERKSKQIQVAEFADQVRYRFLYPFNGLGSENMETLEENYRQDGQFPEGFRDIMYKASKDSIFEHIYYIPASSQACQNQEELLIFEEENRQFAETTRYKPAICEGFGIAQTRMKALINEYRFNNKVLFDTNRGIYIALINQSNRSVFGYLAMPIDKQYMINGFLKPILKEKFGQGESPALTVWLRDWTIDEIIASSDSSKTYNRDEIQFRQEFPDLFDYWRLYASVNEESFTAAARPSLLLNLSILGVALIFLIGAMLFLFITARRERALAERQSGFLANVTHELKTPLAVMQAAGENLADGRVDNQERLQTYGSHIYSEAVRLRKMIEKLLNVAKADAGESFIHPRPVAINALLHQFVAEHQSYIKDKGFTLETSIPDAMPMVMLDKSSLNTIVSNLANNAVKYSINNKFLGIYLSHKGKDIILEVKDHGIGISNKAIKHIFEKFYREEDPLKAKTKGYGLGLSIVKNLVELNNGTINVSSSKERGSTFTVTFPALPEDELQPSKQTPQPNSIKNPQPHVS
jgi:signal transduction histidine kinase